MGPWRLILSSRELCLEGVTFRIVPWRCRCCCRFMRSRWSRRCWGALSFVQWWPRIEFSWWCTFWVFPWTPGPLSFGRSLFKNIYLLVQLLLWYYFTGQAHGRTTSGPGCIDLTVRPSSYPLVHVHHELTVYYLTILSLALLRAFWLHHLESNITSIAISTQGTTSHLIMPKGQNRKKYFFWDMMFERF